MAKNREGVKTKLLAVRLSALGDIAMTVPVITSLARQWPSLDITVMSKPFAAPLFAHMPDNVHVKCVNTNNYKGFFGLCRLAAELKREGYTEFADLHDVLRTKIIRRLLRLTGVKVAVIDKGREEKKALTREKNKEKRALPTSFDRYVMTFEKLGYKIEGLQSFNSIYGNGKGDPLNFEKVTAQEPEKVWVGFAPFAAHKGKTLLEETTEELINLIAKRHSDWKLFLFGGGKTETLKLNKLAESHPNVISVAGKLKLEGELSLMSHLDVMISMDSANMHLASITNTPVVSIWGATHPYAGFMGWHQKVENSVQIDLECRPCSIFGNRPCLRGDYQCLQQINANDILLKIEAVVKNRKKEIINE